MATIKELKRMCDTCEDCSDCPLGDTCHGDNISALPDNTDEIVDKWVEEHPIKTYAMDFFKKFPNAKRNGKGTPVSRGAIVCRKELYVDELPCIWFSGSCSKCWNREMKEE